MRELMQNHIKFSRERDQLHPCSKISSLDQEASQRDFSGMDYLSLNKVEAQRCHLEAGVE